MQKAYKDLDIQFLPNNIVTELNQQTLSTKLSSISASFIIPNSSINHSISTEILSTNNLVQTDRFLDNLNVLNEHVQNFMMTYFEKLF
jgi:hypothetical protein